MIGPPAKTCGPQVVVWGAHGDRDAGDDVEEDTSFLYALVAEKDDDHLRVREVLEAYRGRQLSDLALTTNLVVGETLTLARSKGHSDPGVRHDRAVGIGRQLWSGRFGKVHRVTEDEERDAFGYFTKHRDKVYSFVDRTSFVVMERLGIDVAWAVDSDFTHRFTAIPGPRPK